MALCGVSDQRMSSTNSIHGISITSELRTCDLAKLTFSGESVKTSSRLDSGVASSGVTNASDNVTSTDPTVFNRAARTINNSCR